MSVFILLVLACAAVFVAARTLEECEATCNDIQDVTGAAIAQSCRRIAVDEWLCTDAELKQLRRRCGRGPLADNGRCASSVCSKRSKQCRPPHRETCAAVGEACEAGLGRGGACCPGAACVAVSDSAHQCVTRGEGRQLGLGETCGDDAHCVSGRCARVPFGGGARACAAPCGGEGDACTAAGACCASGLKCLASGVCEDPAASTTSDTMFSYAFGLNAGEERVIRSVGTLHFKARCAVELSAIVGRTLFTDTASDEWYCTTLSFGNSNDTFGANDECEVHSVSTEDDQDDEDNTFESPAIDHGVSVTADGRLIGVSESVSGITTRVLSVTPDSFDCYFFGTGVAFDIDGLEGTHFFGLGDGEERQVATSGDPYFSAVCEAESEFMQGTTTFSFEKLQFLVNTTGESFFCAEGRPFDVPFPTDNADCELSNSFASTNSSGATLIVSNENDGLAGVTVSGGHYIGADTETWLVGRNILGSECFFAGVSFSHALDNEVDRAHFTVHMLQYDDDVLIGRSGGLSLWASCQQHVQTDEDSGPGGSLARMYMRSETDGWACLAGNYNSPSVPYQDEVNGVPLLANDTCVIHQVADAERNMESYGAIDGSVGLDRSGNYLALLTEPTVFAVNVEEGVTDCLFSGIWSKFEQE